MAPFGFGMIVVYLSVMNYLIDSHTIYVASVLAANSVMRCLFGTPLPLFTQQIYDNLGTQWASSIPAFLDLACVPLPFPFYRYRQAIRVKCKFAAESGQVMLQIAVDGDAREEASGINAAAIGTDLATSRHQLSRISDTDDEELSGAPSASSMARSASLQRTSTVIYKGNPYNIGWVNMY
jgi:hypothetical protein